MIPTEMKVNVKPVFARLADGPVYPETCLGRPSIQNIVI